MCGAGLLGWERRGPGTHHYSWQSHVHRYPVQGECTQQSTTGCSLHCNSCRSLSQFYLIMFKCPLVLRLWYYISSCSRFTFLSSILFFSSPFFHHRTSSKLSRRLHLSHQTTLLFCPLKIIAGISSVSKKLNAQLFFLCDDVQK